MCFSFGLFHFIILLELSHLPMVGIKDILRNTLFRHILIFIIIFIYKYLMYKEDRAVSRANKVYIDIIFH